MNHLHVHRSSDILPGYLIGKNGFDIIHPEDIPNVRMTLKRYMKI